MNYIQIQNQRINLDRVLFYYPTDRYSQQTTIGGKAKEMYYITFVYDNSFEKTIEFVSNKSERDQTIQQLDLLCQINKPHLSPDELAKSLWDAENLPPLQITETPPQKTNISFKDLASAFKTELLNQISGMKCTQEIPKNTKS